MFYITFLLSFLGSLLQLDQNDQNFDNALAEESLKNTFVLLPASIVLPIFIEIILFFKLFVR